MFAARMPKWLKLILGLCLLPICWGTTAAVVRAIRVSLPEDRVWVALLAGFATWLVVYLLLPRPRRAYILGHELTHALWSLLFGGRVRSLKVGADRGQVVVTRSNALVALAPYFFPLYATLILTVFMVGDLIWGWTEAAVYFHLLLGAAYGFHATFTVEALRSPQSDLVSQGLVFSAAIIWLGNAMVLLLALAALTGRVGGLTALNWVAQETGRALGRLGAWL
jgi:hypothetical protein